MSVFDSVAEVDTHIAAYKKAILSLATASEYTVDTGLTRRTFKKVDLPEVKKHLLWLQNERAILSGATKTGVVYGRPTR